jgi:phosphoglycerol transferase MdoB-like AlkP superfamily enzyme
MTAVRRMHSGFGRLALVALVAVTVLGGTLAFGTGSADARTFTELCAFQDAGMNEQLGNAGASLREGNYQRAMALLTTAQGVWQYAAEAGC